MQTITDLTAAYQITVSTVLHLRSCAFGYPSLSFGGVLYCRQVWAKSLEAIALIIIKSVWRISAFCMHAGMQIQGDTVTCTFPSVDRPIPTRPQCSTLPFERLGAAITQTAL